METTLVRKLKEAENGIGARLRAQREKAGYIQRELAELAGTTQATVQKIENGRAIRARCLPGLAAALKVNPAWLQWGEPYAKKLLIGGNGFWL